MDGFFEPKVRAAVAAALDELGPRTTVAVSVAVRRSVGTYPEASLLGGLIVLFAYLAVFLYFPEPFTVTYLPAELAGAAVVGALVVRAFPSLARRLSSGRRRSRAVEGAAAQLFVEREAGLVVLVAAHERAAVVTGAPRLLRELGEPLSAARKKLDRAVRLDEDPARFEGALRELLELLVRHAPSEVAIAAAREESDTSAAGTNEANPIANDQADGDEATGDAAAGEEAAS
jgi:hypothetical protein